MLRLIYDSRFDEMIRSSIPKLSSNSHQSPEGATSLECPSGVLSVPRESQAELASERIGESGSRLLPFRNLLEGVRSQSEEELGRRSSFR